MADRAPEHADGKAAISAERLLRSRAESIDVPEGEALELREDSPNFFHVEVDSFRDLQLLGFVPREMRAEEFEAAVKADDDAALNYVMRQGVGAGCSGCGRSGQAVGLGTVAEGLSLGAQYKAFRANFHPNLAKSMSEHVRARLGFDSAIVKDAYFAVRSLGRVRRLGVLFAEDITIRRGATLRVRRNQRLLFANNIYVHDTGTLEVVGGYLKIWANNICRFDYSIEDVVITHIKPTWLL